MKLSKSGIFLIVVLVIAIGLGVWVAIMTCDVLAKDPITMPDRGSAAGTPRPVQNADKPKEPDTFVISMVGDCTLASIQTCLLYTSPSPRDRQKSRMPSSA